jgi:hypothetical protein
MFDALESALKTQFPAIQEKYGYTLKFGSGKYTPGGTNLTLTITATKIGEKSPEELAYESVQSYTLGLPPLGTELDMAGKIYRIKGIKPRGSKILIEDISNGKVYLTTLNGVKSAWELKCLREHQKQGNLKVIPASQL